MLTAQLKLQGTLQRYGDGDVVDFTVYYFQALDRVLFDGRVVPGLPLRIVVKRWAVASLVLYQGADHF
jgi:3-hydroxymyristoyl/3-hydroxydecanoyl-(acyl carrier protein) dehydratase